jgi:hypothetical protein
MSDNAVVLLLLLPEVSFLLFSSDEKRWQQPYINRWLFPQTEKVGAVVMVGKHMRPYGYTVVHQKVSAPVYTKEPIDFFTGFWLTIVSLLAASDASLHSFLQPPL